MHCIHDCLEKVEFRLQGTQLGCIQYLGKLDKPLNDTLSMSEVHKAPVVKHYKVSDSTSESPILKYNAIEFKIMHRGLPPNILWEWFKMLIEYNHWTHR